jgi:hypothetical protein
VWNNESLAQRAQQVAAQFPAMAQVNSGVVAGLGFSAYTCTDTGQCTRTRAKVADCFRRATLGPVPAHAQGAFRLPWLLWARWVRWLDVSLARVREANLVSRSWPVMTRTGGELFIHGKASSRDELYSLVTAFVDALGPDVSSPPLLLH